MLLQTPLPTHSVLTNEWLRHQETGFFTKAPSNLQFRNWFKGGMGNILCLLNIQKFRLIIQFE